MVWERASAEETACFGEQLYSHQGQCTMHTIWSEVEPIKCNNEEN